jgi:hypothetical protein
MKLEFIDNKDFWTGVMLVTTGAAAIFIARDYAFGSALRMGPGYFPTVLGAVIVLFGVYLVAKGLRGGEKIEGGVSLRALIVLPLSLVLFGILMERAGFVPALALLIFGSAAAGPQFRLLEVLIFTAFLTAVSVAVFVWGLGLPYQLFADF